MSRIDPPAGGASVFDHQPELFRAFNAVYGMLWTLGEVDAATKEVARIRNARQVGCKICMNIRFASARDAGLTEDMVQEIDDDFAASDLPPRHKLAARLTDVLLRDPAGMPDDVRAALLDELTPPQVVELMLTAALASGFSKAAVTWGPPPELPTTIVPTPTPNPDDRYR